MWVASMVWYIVVLIVSMACDDGVHVGGILLPEVTCTLLPFPVSASHQCADLLRGEGLRQGSHGVLCREKLPGTLPFM